MKWVLRVVIMLVIVAAVGAIVYWSQMDRAASKAVTDDIASAGRVPCEADKVSLSTLRGRMTVRDMTIKNPPACVGAEMLNIKSATADLKVRTLWNQPVRVKKLEVVEPRLRVEAAPEGSNVRTFLSAVAASTRADRPAAAGEREPARMIIDRVVIKDATVGVDPKLAKGVRVVSIPSIELTDVRGPDGRGVTSAELSAMIVRRMADRAARRTNVNPGFLIPDEPVARMVEPGGAASE